MRLMTHVVLFLIIILGITFAGLNATPVNINYYLGTHSFPLSLLLVLTLVVGFLVGILVGIGLYLKQKKESYRLSNRMRILEKEISNLRTIPLKDDH